MDIDDASNGGDLPASLPNPVVAHELTFGRECTSGYLLEQEARHAAVVEACARQLDATPPQHVPLEQRKSKDPIRI